jgi:hypothetical protein
MDFGLGSLTQKYAGSPAPNLVYAPKNAEVAGDYSLSKYHK